MKIHIIYKVCDSVPSVHGLPRPFGLTKKQVINVCVQSLRDSIKGVNHYVSVVADACSKETMDIVTEALQPTTVYNPEQAVGYRAIMAQAGDYAAASPDDEWVYFVEDDYLHLPEAFAPRLQDFMDLVYNQRKFALPCFLHPSDYPDQYTRLLSRCYVFQGQTGYWREVVSTTETYFCPVSFYKKKASFYKEAYLSDGAEGIGSDFKTSSLFRKEALCFCPLPGFATHMHEHVMSNFVNWSEVVARYLPPTPAITTT